VQRSSKPKRSGSRVCCRPPFNSAYTNVPCPDEEKLAARSKTIEEKNAVKQEKEAEKEKKAEEKRLAREDKRRSKEGSKGAGTGAATGAALGTAALAGGAGAPVLAAEAASPSSHAPEARTEEDDNDLYRDPTPAGHALQASEPELQHEQEVDATSPDSPISPTSPTSERKGIKGFLNKFKRRSKHSASSAETDKPGFIGGVALQNSTSHSQKDESIPSESRNNSVSHSPHPEPTYTTESHRRHSDVSSISADPPPLGDRGRSAQRASTGLSAVSAPSTDPEEARDAFDEDLAPPPTFTTVDSDVGRKGSPNRDSKFREVGL
jgi:hypothetical protein